MKPTAEPRRQVGAVILAAGRATRFGAGPRETKATALFAGKPLVRHVAEAALASRTTPVVVVTGHAATAVEAALAGLPLTITHNSDFATGLASSLQSGVAALPQTVAGALILLADMPRITAASIDRLVAAFEVAEDAPLAVVPVHAGQRGNPVLIGRGLFEALMSLTGDRGARPLLDAAGNGLLEVPVDDAAVLLDIDTRQALGDLGV